jgi:hypothetical protein
VEEDEESMEEQSTLAVPFVEEQVEESSTE